MKASPLLAKLDGGIPATNGDDFLLDYHKRVKTMLDYVESTNVLSMFRVRWKFHEGDNDNNRLSWFPLLPDGKRSHLFLARWPWHLYAQGNRGGFALNSKIL
jgi:hypothetical protein